MHDGKNIQVVLISPLLTSPAPTFHLLTSPFLPKTNPLSQFMAKSYVRDRPGIKTWGTGEDHSKLDNK